MNLLQQLNWRYATKIFDPSRSVNGEDIAYLKEAVRLSPSSYGLQPYRVLVIHNRDLQERLVEASYGQRQVADASHVFVFCNIRLDRQAVDDYMQLIKKQRGTPDDVLDAKAARLWGKISEMGAEKSAEWAARQSYIAMTQLLIACAEKKIDSCPIEGFEPEKYSGILGLEEKGLYPVLVVPVGYRHPADAHAKDAKVRKEPEDLFIEL